MSAIWGEAVIVCMFHQDRTAVSDQACGLLVNSGADEHPEHQGQISHRNLADDDDDPLRPREGCERRDDMTQPG
jgi:hypothetical protein